MNRYPAENVQFEMGNATGTLRWDAGYFDLVHARFVTLGVSENSFQSPLALNIWLPSYRYRIIPVFCKKLAA